MFTAQDFIKKDAGSVVHAVGQMVGPASYTTGGVAVKASEFGGLALLYGGDTFVGVVTATGVAAYLATFRPDSNPKHGVQTGKMVITQLSDGAQVANATDLSGHTFRGSVHGR